MAPDRKHCNALQSIAGSFTSCQRNLSIGLCTACITYASCPWHLQSMFSSPRRVIDISDNKHLVCRCLIYYLLADTSSWSQCLTMTLQVSCPLYTAYMCSPLDVVRDANMLCLCTGFECVSVEHATCNYLVHRNSAKPGAARPERYACCDTAQDLSSS